MNENWTEKLIDAHLQEPNIAEPRPGFESRLLAQVAERRATRRSPAFWMVWASTAAVAAVIIAIVFFVQPVPKPLQVQRAKVVAPTHGSGTTGTDVGGGKATIADAPLGRRSTFHRSAIAPAYPEKFFGGAESAAFFQPSPNVAAAFPTASPLNDEEQMLEAMVGRMSGSQQRALVEALEASRIPDAEPVAVPESSLRPVSEIKNTH